MIELINAVCGYGKRTVLDGFSLTLKKGEIISVIGPNGSGKSTFLKTVAGIIPLLSGKLLIDGISADVLSGRARAVKIAYLPQESSIPDMSVYDSVLQGRYPHVGVFGSYGKKDRDVAERTMKEMGLWDISGRKMSELSGGMRRRVHIASALAEETDYILLDEPCAYLDIIHQLELMTLLKRLAHTFGKSIVVVMHDLPLTFNLSDRVTVMSKGSVVISDTPEKVLGSGCVQDVFGVNIVIGDSGYYLPYKNTVKKGEFNNAENIT